MYTHKAAYELISRGDFLEALCAAGPMLKTDSSDIEAWYLVARSLHGLGEKQTAMKNLKSLALAAVESGRPVWALSLIKEIKDFGEDTEDLIRKMATMYAAGSGRVEKAEPTPPPLPSIVPIERWDSDTDPAELIASAKKCVAVACGDSLASVDKRGRLPYIPLLSDLSPGDFELLVETFLRQVFAPKEVIIEQDAVGDAIYLLVQGEVAVSRRLNRGEKRQLARLGPGALFGEMSIVSRAPRAADVIALGPTVVLKADRDSIDNLAVRSKKARDVLIAFCHARMLENLVRVSPVLSRLPAPRRPDLIARFETDYFESGDVVIEQGSDAQGLYLVVSGALDVVREEQTDNLIVAKLGPGDVFGEISLVMQKPSTAAVIAREDTAVLFLSSSEFHEVTNEFPELLKGAFDIAIEREAENRSILASPEAAADDLILL